jgi:DNA-directed RNA polymerase specialized sigma24 family protein
MINAEEVFTMQLARAAGKIANRFLHARGLQKADRDDVIMEALGWCWAHRAQYSLTTTLETWFMNAVRDAYKKFTKMQLPSEEDSTAQAHTADTTYQSAAAASSAQALVEALTPIDREIAQLTMAGYTYREIFKRGYPERTVRDAHQRIKQLRRLLPERELRDFIRSTARSSRAPNLDELDEAPQSQPSRIDIEIARLDFAPHAGKDCPPCFRCMWFEGFMPSGKLDTRLEIVDVEVRAAVKDTEARKIEIAQQVRYGK